MADEVATETLVPGELPADWREATLAIARRERQTTLRHPWLVDLVARRSMLGRVGPNMLRHSDQSIAALTSLDVDPTRKWRLLTAGDEPVPGGGLAFACAPVRAARRGVSSDGSPA
jgi:hypothetical protein